MERSVRRKSIVADRHINGCLRCPVRKSTICGPLGTNQIRIVENFKSGNRTLPAGSLLYHEGDVCPDLFNILDGWVSLCRNLENGRHQILNFMMPGAFLGFQSDLMEPMRNSARCITDTVVCIFPRRAFPTLLENNPSLALSLNRRQAAEEEFTHDHLTNIATRPARARLAHLMLELHTRVIRSYPNQNSADISLPLNQQHIADALGLTNVHVCRAISTLHRENLLSFKKGRLQILDSERLSEIAQFTA